MGLEESGLARLVREAYHLLGLQSFFTSGPMEVRAWTIPIGAKAPQAAGTIHTDFERGFIKAETASFEDYSAYDGEKGCAMRASFAKRARITWCRTAMSCTSNSMCKHFAHLTWCFVR